ncbi:hypothetical protein HRI_000974300 [Hibiscus trionum]|uniref:Reverse transcriptase domain-containing protein n=1 Tax=Hibiscus trionum TaxID=183268 RepID=A0A9W7H8U3_HIBTR|nr:hypothetical protein HRI_000974300 [Hibiscus trionum]
MKIMSWNVRGLNKPRTVGRLRQKLLEESPGLIFLIETKVKDSKMAEIRRKCGFLNGIDVSAVRRSGGLSLGWKNCCKVTLRSYSVRHVDVLIEDDSDGNKWRCTGFYGHPEEQHRGESWDLLRSLDDMPDIPWLVIGDFNELLLSSEKQGGRDRPVRQMKGFSAVLNECGLDDLGFTGQWFTWEKGKFSNTNVRERLDRGVASGSWWDLFPDFKVYHLQHTFSDHCPILVNTGFGSSAHVRTGQFRFEAAWLLEESCEPEVQKLWSLSSGDYLDRLSQVKKGLDRWFKDLRRKKTSTLAVLKKKLAYLNEQTPSDEVLGEITDTKLSMNFELDKEEIFWEQRARSNWLKHGDRNTSFFHRCASQRRRKNKVKSLENVNGEVCSEDNEMLEVATNYFSSLFTSSTIGDCSRILEGVNVCISESMNLSLRKAFTAAEIWDSVKSMSPLKAAGENGLGALFFQKFWHVIGDDTVTFCLTVLKQERPMSDINQTRIVLVPKVDNPTGMSQFRPISLCNVLFKIISKTLANRLKLVLPLCIDEAQSAFVPGRLITDNVLAAYEIFHSMRMKKGGKNGFLTAKLDMFKAYDRVEWNFLHSMMTKMGFDEGWISILMDCISTVSYSVILNGSIGDFFHPSRGLRQGDPISPYLFLICGEGLSSLLRQQSSGIGYKIARGAPSVTYLFFADDSVIFAEASTRGASVLRDVLTDYEMCSGQCINYEKSGLFFSANVGEDTRQDVARILRIRNAINPEKYLGLPTVVGRNKKQAFFGLRDRLLACINSWSARVLSQGGKEVFIKSVLQAIPTYTMSCFLLPKTFCRGIESILARFWWRNSKDKKGIHWSVWSELCALKENGGMGFRDMCKFNVALLAKQGWRLITNPMSLIARLLRAKYHPTSSFLNSRVGANPSYTWRSIWCARGLLEKGLRDMIGDGSTVRVWSDFWVPSDYPRKLQAQSPTNVTFVSELIDNGSMTWKEDMIRGLFSPQDARKILSIPLSSSNVLDSKVWCGERNGVYSVRSGYRLLLEVPNTNTSLRPVLKQVWQSGCPTKMNIQCWKFIRNFVPTKRNLCIKRVTNNPICPRCLQEPEDVAHVIRNCRFAERVWFLLGIQCNYIHQDLDIANWLTTVIQTNGKHHMQIIIIAIWFLWITRNNFVFEGIVKTPEDVVTSTRSYWLDVKAVSTKLSSSNPSLHVRWSPPSSPAVRVNCDASYDISNGSADLGVAIRNEEGLILGAMSRRVFHVASPFAAEAYAVLHGLHFAWDLGFPMIELSSDSRSVIMKLKSEMHDRSEISNIIREAKSFSRRLAGISYLFSPRSSNRVAHALAHLRRSLSEDGFWVEDAPPSIVEIINTDRRWFSDI